MNKIKKNIDKKDEKCYIKTIIKTKEGVNKMNKEDNLEEIHKSSKSLGLKRLAITTLIVILLIITTITIQTTYARYITSLEAKSYIELGRWSLSVNNQNIIQNSDISGVLSPNLQANADIISSNVIAPGSIAYIDVVINYKDVTVPFQYTLTYTEDPSTKIEDFNLTYFYNNGALIYDLGNDDTITNTIVPDGTAVTQTIRINLQWKDDNGNILTDIEDTNIAKQIEDLKYNINIEFEQLSSPPITNANIGEYISFGNDLVGTTSMLDDWRILYVEDDTVYAILADYLPNETGYAENAGLETSDISSVYTSYDAETLLNVLNDESAWAELADGVNGAKVMGSPTVELLMNSYNLKNKTTLKYEDTPELNIATIQNTLYMPSAAGYDSNSGYWLSSYDSDTSEIRVMCTDGTVDTRTYDDYDYWGIRPVVAFPISTKVEYSRGVWYIMD